MQSKLFRFSAGLVTAAIMLILVVNSCKKDNATPLKNYLTNYGPWQLASLQVTSFVHNTTTANIISTDTLAATCTDTTQSLSFTTAGGSVCSYYNFQCNQKSYSGSWSLNTDSLTLHMLIAPPNTTSKYPFATCGLGNLGNGFEGNLGRSLLVFMTGDLNGYYSDNNVHKIYRYSFIHPVTAGQ